MRGGLGARLVVVCWVVVVVVVAAGCSTVVVQEFRTVAIADTIQMSVNFFIIG